MVFPVVMYGCESWIVKMAEGQIIDTFKLWLDCKEINPEYSLEGLMLKLQ